jgi:hypothetical protein
MAVLAQYTPNALARYMDATAKKVASFLQWSPEPATPDDDEDAGSYQHPIDEVTRRMQADISSHDTPEEVGLLLLYAKHAVWEYAVTELTTAYDVGGLAQTLSRGQMWAHAVDARDKAKEELDNALAADTLEELGFIRGIPFSQVVRVRTQWGADSPWSNEA